MFFGSTDIVSFTSRKNNTALQVSSNSSTALGPIMKVKLFNL